MSGDSTPSTSSKLLSRTTSSPTAYQGPAVEHLLHLGPSGVVFKSPTSVEMGVEMAVGLHVQQHFEAACGQEKCKNRFIILDGIVVDSSPVDCVAGESYHQISLLFDNLDEEAEEMIRMLCEQQAALEEEQQNRGVTEQINSTSNVALN